MKYMMKQTVRTVENDDKKDVRIRKILDTE